MKTKLLYVLLVLSLVASGALWYRVSALTGTNPATADYPLGENMGYLQRYADKLWFAGDAGNWDLARYYHDELLETAEGIAAAGVDKDGFPVSQQLQSELPPVLQGMDEAITARDPALFRERYQAMVAACNACHQAAQHEFIHVIVPAGPPTAWNQEFTPRSPEQQHQCVFQNHRNASPQSQTRSDRPSTITNECPVFSPCGETYGEGRRITGGPRESD